MLQLFIGTVYSQYVTLYFKLKLCLQGVDRITSYFVLTNNENKNHQSVAGGGRGGCDFILLLLATANSKMCPPPPPTHQRVGTEHPLKVDPPRAFLGPPEYGERNARALRRTTTNERRNETAHLLWAGGVTAGGPLLRNSTLQVYNTESSSMFCAYGRNRTVPTAGARARTHTHDLR